MAWVVLNIFYADHGVGIGARKTASHVSKGKGLHSGGKRDSWDTLVSPCTREVCTGRGVEWQTDQIAVQRWQQTGAEV